MSITACRPQSLLRISHCAIHRGGVSILLVEQNTQLALTVSTRTYVLQSGRIMLEGPSAQLLADPRIREAYLGV